MSNDTKITNLRLIHCRHYNRGDAACQAALAQAIYDARVLAAGNNQVVQQLYAQNLATVNQLFGNIYVYIGWF